MALLGTRASPLLPVSNLSRLVSGELLQLLQPLHPIRLRSVSATALHCYCYCYCYCSALHCSALHCTTLL